MANAAGPVSRSLRMVIFGATGDLTKRLTITAFYNLSRTAQAGAY